MTSRIAAILSFFLLRVGVALALLKLTAVFLTVTDFTALTQLLAYAAFLNLIVMAGSQNGVIRQAAAAQGQRELDRLHCSSLSLWMGSAALVVILMPFATGWISWLLVGSPGQRTTVLIMTVIALAAAPGQIWTSILTGRHRTIESLGVQAIGLAAGALGALWFIAHRQVEAAAIAFSGGSLVSAIFALRYVRGYLSRPVFDQGTLSEVRHLLRYSAAFATVSGASAISLFALRSIFRDAFGSVELGHWIAANRISDLSTQLLGLFMLQFFLPHMAGNFDVAGRRRFILQCGAGAMAAMAIPLLIFTLAPEMFVRAFLSDAFLPAIPVIRAYLLGDMLRVWTSLAMFAAFAAGMPGRYAAIELAALAVMAAVTVFLISIGYLGAPQWGYTIGYGSVALVSFAVLLLPRRQLRTASIMADTA